MGLMSRVPNRPPNRLLRGVRESRHESREELARLIEQETGEPADFRLIKRWENKGVIPRPIFRRAVMAITGKSAAELGWAGDPVGTFTRDDADRLAWAAQRERADMAVVGLYAQLLGRHRAGGPLIKPRQHVEAVSGDLSKLLALRRNAPPDVRRALLAVASEYGQFIARHAFEGGDIGIAEQWSARALEWALAAGATEHAAYVLMRQSSYAADTGDPQRIIDLARASRELPWKLTPGLESLSRRHEAKGHALAGDPDECRRLLDQAVDLFDARRPEEEPSYARDHSLAFFQLQAADYGLSLGRPEPAIETLRDHLPTLPASRHRAWSAARLAHGYADVHDTDSAATLALETLSMANDTGAARAVRELRRLCGKLARSNRPAVRDFIHALPGSRA
jgi:hypothetical protein